ncbi:hypothetical protein J2S74_004543 [Evansella vedderi]|uniref:Apea-like HEPN domain-containing protein n=1 Tax=Evansella vedderi TaxID=38282 RepID=A0ABU0A278_9BACI|nr:hypothetical protein [Evansella vedderi]MDQ0257097.1 hypothetical protein [Evansella vedderi]
MEEVIRKLIKNIDGEIDMKFDYENVDSNIRLSKARWKVVFYIILSDNEETNLSMIDEYIANLSDIDSLIEENNTEIWIGNESLTIYHEDWPKEYYIELEKSDFTTIFSIIKDFISLKYIPVLACYREDYFEVLINHSEIVWGDGLSHISVVADKKENIKEKIFYEITPISKEFSTIIMNNQFYSHIEVEDSFTTLKVYNVNTNTNISMDSQEIEEKLLYYAKCILFDLSYKYSVTITFEELPMDDEDEGDFEYISEELNEIKAPYLKKEYDPDLLDYYHRALEMSESEFKYLAYYQVLECIFDEVYLHETVQDVKQIMNSNWFSSYKDSDIREVIETVDKYNKSKNDREKLKLVLERYFKGEVHEEAYLLANRDITKILKNELNKISQDKDVKDLQKLATVLYDFRCACTHSNRTFPFRASYDKTNEELKVYIKLIKQVVEKVIQNYVYIS